MVRRILAALVCAFALQLMGSAPHAQAQEAYGRQWASSYSTQDWDRFYHYPYVYYPQNFWGDEYYRSAESLYYRYPPEMRSAGVQQTVAQRVPAIGPMGQVDSLQLRAGPSTLPLGPPVYFGYVLRWIRSKAIR